MTDAARNSTQSFGFAEYGGSNAGHPQPRSNPRISPTGVPIPLVASRNAMEDDNGQKLVCTDAVGFTYTVPAGLIAGFEVALVQGGAGPITVAAGAGVTITNVSGYTKTGGISAVICLIQTGNNTYSLIGQGI